MVDDSTESLPIAQDPVTMSLHFTPPTQQVFLQGGSGMFDIAGDSFGDDFASETARIIDTSSLKVEHSSRISISYDVQKVDDMTAADFLHRVKALLDDPELLML